MADGEGDTNKNNILYELLVLSEWREDYDSVISKNVLNNSIQESNSFFNPWKFLRKSKLDNLRYLQTEYPWHLAVSKDGKVLAVLQETLLEIKTAKDEFSSIVGKACLPNDEYPKLRKLSWSPDNSFVAVARDNGIVLVYNLFGCNVATVEPPENRNSTLQTVVELCFLQPKFENAKWSNELLIVYQKGIVKSILLSALDGYESDENIKYSLEKNYPLGISSVAYSCNHLLVVAGPPNGNDHGITVWRILNDYPHLKNAFDSEKLAVSSRSFLRFLPLFQNQNHPNTIIKMKVSPDNKLLVCLHLSGGISLWRMPGIALISRWNLHEQPQYYKCNPVRCDDVKNEEYLHPVDINWWSDDVIVIARRNGALSVCSISTLENLLGDSPEFLAESPQISSIQGDRSEVIALECEIENNQRKENDENVEKESDTSVFQASIQAALYSVTDIERFEPKRKTVKLVQRTYRLIALKRTTPEELYTRKIDREEYEEALTLAKKYNLDCDLVYQKRWRNSQVSAESIYNYLDKVSKINWVVKECVERVPDGMKDAKELLEFGLKKTEMKCPILSKLTQNEKQLISYRKLLLQYLDRLTIYEKIIGSSAKYNSGEYDSFRKKQSIVATVNFARLENWQAVSIMFTYVGKRVLPHWLPILSNFPETLRPLHYRSLLPEVVDGEVIPWEVKKLRDLDWSEKPPFESLSSEEKYMDDAVLYEQGAEEKEFHANVLTADIVERWYKKRTYEIENKTSLVEYALAFVVLGRERGIKNLSQLYNNLLTLEALVYLVGDQTITLAKLEALNHFEHCKLLLSKTTKNSFMDDLKNFIVPFSKRCKEQGCHSDFSLLKNTLLYFSENSLELPLELLNYLKQGFLNPFTLTFNETATIVLDCIYSCPKDDQLENCFFILECLPQRVNSLSKEDKILHDRIDSLENHLEIAEVLNRYKIPKSVRFIYESEDNPEVGRQLMEEMADYTREETLYFSELLSDLQFIQSKAFSSIPSSFAYELCALSQMSCECEEIIESAEQIMETRKGEKDKVVPFERSIELVLKAARRHFEKATTFDDHYILLSQTCLKIINEPHSEICEELDLIEAVQLLGDFSMNVLPLKVRKQENRMMLIESCLKAKPNNYKSCQRLLQLAQSLRIHGENRTQREGEVLILIAQHALNSTDYQYCNEMCGRLITKNYPPAWSIVRSLARSPEYENSTNKKLLFAFAILHCPDEDLEELLEARVELHQKHFKFVSFEIED